MIRIHSGFLKNKKLLFHECASTRPTKDRIRASIFDVLCHRLGPDFGSLNFLDAFAGTGAFGFEACSLGANSVQFIEQNHDMQKMLIQNLRLLNVEDKCSLFCGSLFDFKIVRPFDVVFLDPPYGKGLVEKSVDFLSSAPMKPLWIIECAKKEEENILAALIAKGLSLVVRKSYGKISLLFLQNPFQRKVQRFPSGPNGSVAQKDQGVVTKKR